MMISSGEHPRPSDAESFIRSARRRQLVDSAIEVIAELGAAHASVVKIAHRAGVSRGVFAYHFRDVDDLTDAVVDEVYRLGGEQLRSRVAGAPTPRDALLEFVGGSVHFYSEYPDHIAALQEIFVVRRRSRKRSRAAVGHHTKELDDVAALLRAGQEAGQFRDFDVAIMADSVRAVLDTAVPRLINGYRDVPGLAAELVAAVDALVRKEDPA